MDPLRIYLLAGLLAHKGLWEMLKRRRQPSSPAAPKAVSPATRLVKTAKIAILLGIVAQCMLPDVFPIAADSSALRLAGGIVYTIGLLIAILGRLQLGDNWLDIETADVLKGQRVVSNGIYGFIRHPIYVGDLILLAGLELALNSWLILFVAVLIPAVLRQAIKEEKLLAGTLPGYDVYCRRTKRFIPFVA